MTAPADRNLLFGLLALQNGMIDQSALVAAFHAWTRDKKRTIAEILLAQGVIDTNDRTVLESLVTNHLKRHGDDVEKSLAAVAAPRAVVSGLVAMGDEEVNATIGHVGSSAHPTVPNVAVDSDATASMGKATGEGQRFRVLRPHARGGLGAVFVALDAELNREVALKQILDHHADDPTSRTRFVLEAEITGGLEHPGIVPVYGLGSDGGGRPYYAMRFIRGDSLKDAIAAFHTDPKMKDDPGRRSLALRKLLRRFVDVCNAIEYAHTRGVIHRDIKPANIIVGKYGETLVVDWGLAKAMGKAEPGTGERTFVPSSASGSAETLPGSALGTPAYMSPDQAAGDVDRLGPRSDVYSLGATLYCLLTGRPPQEGNDVGELLRRVQRGEYPKPRQLDASIDPALEAVCLKAMATDQDGRYASSRALADDVERWMADEPVTAWREPLSRRARRWARRNRTVVAAVAVALCMGLVGLGAVAAVQTQARNDLDTKNQELAKANNDMEAQRKRAEAREKLAIDAVKKYRDAVINEPVLKNDPSLGELRKRLLREPLAFFRSLREQLQATQDSRPESLEQLAEASWGLAALNDEIGDRQDALKSYYEMLSAYQQLVAAHPTVAQYKYKLAQCQNHIGYLQSSTGDHAVALESYREALKTQDSLATANPNDAEYQSLLALTQHNIGTVVIQTSERAVALDSFRKARQIREALVLAYPAVDQYRQDLAQTHDFIGRQLSVTGDHAGALESYEKALKLRESLALANPSIAPYKHAVAVTELGIGNLLCTTDRARALESYRKSLNISESLATENPTVTMYQIHLAVSLLNIAGLQSGPGDHAGALESLRKALKICDSMSSANPTVTETQNYLALIHLNIGNELRHTGDQAGAMESYRKALKVGEALAKANPTITEYQRNFISCHNQIGDLLRQTGDLARAVESYRKVVSICEERIVSNFTAAEYQSQLIASHNMIGDLLRQTGDHAGALESYRAELKLRESDASANPTNAWSQRAVAVSQLGIGNLLAATGKRDEAVEWYRKALSILQSVAQLDPSIAQLQRDIGWTQSTIGNVLRESGDRAGAIESFRKALKVQEALVLANPSGTPYQQELAFTRNSLRNMLIEIGDRSGVLESYRDAMKFQEVLASANPSVPQSQSALAQAHFDIGLVLFEADDPVEAEESFREALKLREPLVSANRPSPSTNGTSPGATITSAS